MHPQIRSPKPGKCPICAMDLIPVTSEGATLSLRQISFSPAAKALMNIQTTPVERRYVTARVRMVGKVAYDETRMKYIAARVPGRLDRLFVDYTGVQVQEGDHLASIYSPELYQAQQELIEAAKSRRERSESNSKFFSDLGGVDLVESAREKLRLWGLAKEQIDSIQKSEKPSDHLTIYSPLSGIVIHKNRNEGDYVQVGERIYAVADLSQVWVLLDAYESDLPWLRYGQEVAFQTEAYPGEEFTGRIAFIDPVLNDKTRTVKVRVNVPNLTGQLKPDMFVQATVKAQVAAGGRVIDDDLAGKWISPMHPEIVKDEPGTCDICGMPLVRAESLGYVPDSELSRNAPLIVPKSAVLRTGTRAVVYVEMPKEKKPTYVGREIVLGPRAGDFYQVATGLQEGDLVVTNGTFKIDSALQIQAKPSMMTPTGGGSMEQAEGEMAASIPPAFHAQLRKLDAAAKEVTQALDAQNLQQIQTAFEGVRQALDQVDGELLPDQPPLQWNELQMLLRNDVVEGQSVKQLDEAQRIAQNLSQTMNRVRSQWPFGHEGEEPYRLDVPEPFLVDLRKIWGAYLAVQKSLAGDDLSQAEAAVDRLAAAVKTTGSSDLAEKPKSVWAQEESNLQKILAEMQSVDNLRALRGQFQPLTSEMELLVNRFGLGESGPVYKLHCPMAFGNTGASWLQADQQPLNPYFGATMLKCHDKIQKIASGEENASQ